VKVALVCLLLGFVSLSAAQGSSPRPSESINIQRLFKFSGNLASSHREGFVAGAGPLRLAIYNEPAGGKARWQETQNVNVDAQGRYTVLLGETAPEGFPAGLLTSGATYWLGVQASGQPEEARVQLVESAEKVDPIAPSSLIISEERSRYSASDRNLALGLLIMFLVGAWIAYGELRKLWKTHTERYGEPPFVELFRFIPSSDDLRRATQALRDLLSSKLRSVRGRVQQSAQTLDAQTVDIDQPKKAA
jgi:hypothetical protein